MGLSCISLEDKVAIVTGASRGIGRAISLTLAEAGADIVLVSRTREQLEQVAEDILQIGRRALAIPADVTREDQVKMVAEQTVSEFGKIDILCNNAGIVIGKPVVLLPGTKPSGWAGALGEEEQGALTLADWHRVMDTNLTSTFLFAQAVGPHMLKQRKGKVINTSSTAADEGSPYASVYCASKAGLSSFTRCLASEWGPFNVNVNAIAPGVIKTDLSAPVLSNKKMRRTLLERIPIGRLGEPHDVALLVLFLASEASDYVTGQVFTVDGGAMGLGPDI